MGTKDEADRYLAGSAAAGAYREAAEGVERGEHIGGKR